MKDNGLYAASASKRTGSASGYQYTWIRDTVMIANYERELGNTSAASRTSQALTTYLRSQEHRFLKIIADPSLKADDAKRPHVRFDGDDLREIPEPWPHAQNDALGYALWLPFSLANQKPDGFNTLDLSVYSMFPSYFAAIEYWKDKDSGHWEESPKVNNSSIGVVVGALREMRRYIENGPNQKLVFQGKTITSAMLEVLEEKGRKALASLPYESYPSRDTDSALIFLIYPLEIVSGDVADLIIDKVVSKLLGAYGIRRYRGDSYWCENYDRWSQIDDRPSNFSGFLNERDKLLKPGGEAQWCIFDPMLSICYGQRFLANRQEQDLRRQIHYLNRSISQLTPDWKCPELYYLRDDIYRPNDHTPLAWTQANFGTALEYMRRSFSANGVA